MEIPAEENFSPDKFIRQLPKEISGARKIDFIETPGAKFCLVVIKMKHLQGLETEEDIRANSDIHPNIIPIHTDIDLVLNTLVRQGMKDIFIENMSEVYDPVAKDKEWWKTLKQLQRELAPLSSQRKMLSLRFIDEPDDKIREDLKKDLLHLATKEGPIRERYESLRKSVDSRLLGARELVRHGKLHAYPAEKNELIRRASLRGFYTKEEHQQREDFVLQQMVDRRISIASTIYGAWHDFRDNVERWNKDPKNKDQKFSLVIITPRSYSIEMEKKDQEDKE